MTAPSRAGLDLAGFVVAVLDLALFALAVAIWVNRAAPPQDLPWRALSVDRTIGLATRIQLDRTAADPAACRRVLRDGGVAFHDAPLPTRGFCGAPDGLRLADEALAPRGPAMSCPLALSYVVWLRHAAGPAAQELTGRRITAVEHYGTYSCRTVYGREGGAPSRHARADALDVAGVRLDDGRRITVAANFRKNDESGRLIRRLRRDACGLFAAVLGPDYNAAHRDHLHLDRGSYQVCR